MENERTMYKGDWTCSKCNADIKELPFEPRETSGLVCKDCFAKAKEARNDRPMYEGDWKCAGCGTAITKLPFEPRETGNLKCRDCFVKNK